MPLSLIYHRNARATSPFDACAVELSRNADLRIACPYLSLEYLRRLTRICATWRLVSDVEEWLASTERSDRDAVCEFLIDNRSSVRHVFQLHAKVLIGAARAMVGSANLTTSGIQRRTEMAVLIDDPACHTELCKWFDNEWVRGHELPESRRLYGLAKRLPSPRPARTSKLFQDVQRLRAPLTVLDEDRDIRTYRGARGYYVGDRFRVMRGSTAKGHITAEAFYTNSNGLYASIRDSLIQQGILARDQDWADYTFTQDHLFDSSSAAACIVAGQSRSGPKEWGPP